jgi:hypothetical protein
MSGKFNNRTLLVVFVVLAVIFVISRLPGVKKSERSLDTDIVSIDTARVSGLLLYPASEQGSELAFSRSGGSWTVSNAGVSATADTRSVTSALSELMNLKAVQLVARSEERWGDYQVNDSLGTRVVVKEGNKTTLDLVVGRFQYQPPPQNSYNPYQRNQVSGKTYIRLTEEKEIYAVEGFLAMSLNQPFQSWRDKTVTDFRSSNLTRVSFDYPADSGFVAQKNEGGWMVAGIMADSASMASWVNGVARKSHREFADGFQPAGEPDFRVSFEGDNMSPQMVGAYIEEDGQVILNSSVNAGTWFSTTTDDLFADLFPGADQLISP